MSEQMSPALAFSSDGRWWSGCVRITADQFCSMIFPCSTVCPASPVAAVEASQAGYAYRMFRAVCCPGQWLLKSPAHLWQVDALVAEYPDALIVQTHRDPLNVISSISALTHHLRRLAYDESSITECAAQSREEIVVGLERGMKLRDSLAQRVIDVQLADFIRDPFATIRALYAELGRELEPVAEQNMRAFLAGHPGDGGGSRYFWADTGLDAGLVREQVRVYQDCYGVPDEPLK